MNKENKQIEKQLIPRLKIMGYILFSFALISLAYRFTLPPSPTPLFSEEEVGAGLTLLEETDDNLLPSNPKAYYLFASIFTLVGAFCITTARRKATSLKSYGDDD